MHSNEHVETLCLSWKAEWRAQSQFMQIKTVQLCWNAKWHECMISCLPYSYIPTSSDSVFMAACSLFLHETQHTVECDEVGPCVWQTTAWCISLVTCVWPSVSPATRSGPSVSLSSPGPPGVPACTYHWRRPGEVETRYWCEYVERKREEMKGMVW